MDGADAWALLTLIMCALLWVFILWVERRIMEKDGDKDG